MRFGLYGINVGICAVDPAALPGVVRAVEEAGWDSVWAGEHYALPDPPTPQAPAAPGVPMLDPFVALAVAAAHSSTILLGTSVIVVPLHNPVMLAKKLASLDRVSGGRVAFGVGVGYLEPEFRAMGVPLAGRGRRTDDYLDAMAALWAGGAASHDGEYASFAGIRAEPLPVQAGGPPLHVGGYVPAAYRRAVTRGRGWYGYDLTPAAVRPHLDALRLAAVEHERPEHLGPLEITVTPPQRSTIDADLVGAYEELGVTRLAFLPPGPALRDAGALAAFVDTTAGLLAGARRPDRL
jgi:probable F420-dependent oxidoreductase